MNPSTITIYVNGIMEESRARYDDGDVLTLITP